MSASDYTTRVLACLDGLCIPVDIIEARRLPLQVEAEPDVLVTVARSDGGREHQLMPAAAEAWYDLRDAASRDGIELSIVSAYRSLERQAEIVRGKLAAGLSLDEIFRASAPPGYSEHHTGRALDVTTPGVKPLEEEFETTPAFVWLGGNARRFGFRLSYPRDNAHGFMYEPWHWYFEG